MVREEVNIKAVFDQLKAQELERQREMEQRAREAREQAQHTVGFEPNK